MTPPARPAWSSSAFRRTPPSTQHPHHYLVGFLFRRDPSSHPPSLHVRRMFYNASKVPPGYPAQRGAGHHSWLEEVLPTLEPEERPLQCVQTAGDVLYIPENYYHATYSLGETVSMAAQSKVIRTRSIHFTMRHPA